MSMMKEFKQFAMKGNLVDLAVGVVMGVAFGKVVTAFIEGIVMPPIGKLAGGIDFKDIKYVMQESAPEVLDASGGVLTKGVEEVAISYGAFITVTIDFLIVAFVVFMVLKGLNNAKKKQVEAPVAPPAPSKQEVLLSEIRDLLKK